MFLKLISVYFVDEERIIRSKGGGGSKTGSSIFSRRIKYLNKRYLLILKSASGVLRVVPNFEACYRNLWSVEEVIHPVLLRSRAVASRLNVTAVVDIRTLIFTWSQARLLRLLYSGTQHQFLEGWQVCVFLSTASIAAATEIESVWGSWSYYWRPTKSGEYYLRRIIQCLWDPIYAYRKTNRENPLTTS